MMAQDLAKMSSLLLIKLFIQKVLNNMLGGHGMVKGPCNI